MAGDSYLRDVGPASVERQASINSGVADAGSANRLVGLDAGGRITPGLMPTTDATVTGTVGAVTINKMAGQCIMAAAATTVVVTNSLVTANSLIFATLASADATTLLKNVVAGAGSFTITSNAAATANTKINFLVLN